jgi:hypothetical protein
MDYQNPEIAQIYDSANPWADDHDFYLSLVGPLASSILDESNWSVSSREPAWWSAIYSVTGMEERLKPNPHGK